jgi:hypothetical protein
VVAPAGYGKTTLLSQSAEYNCQIFAWVSFDESDNDSNVFLTHVAEALDEVEPIDERASDASASLTSSVPGSVIPRLNSAFWSSGAGLSTLRSFFLCCYLRHVDRAVSAHGDARGLVETWNWLGRHRPAVVADAH